MKIVTISDTHNAHDRLTIPDCDILIHAGDESFRGSEQEVVAFATWLDRQPAKHIIWIPGNHSMGFMHNWPNSLNWIKNVSPRTNVLINSGVEIESLKIWGSPITPWFHDWAYNVHRGAEIREYWNKIPLDTNILITHGPPYKILDVVEPNTRREQSVGCMDLANTIAKIKPKLHVFGHIHESHGRVFQDGTTYVNAAIMDESYDPVNFPTVIDYENLP